ncbi:MAG: imidazole glycerol phosphate synthase subunit HisH [Candidatus Xenobia bacterium]
MSEVLVVRTGTANLASVFAGLARLGATPRLVESAEEVLNAERLVLPGVGAFGAAMANLEARGLVPALQQRLREERPTLAICLGLQLLAASSEESPGVAGLGVLPSQVKRFPDTVRVPQLGWNTVEPDDTAYLVHLGEAYFANSYRLTERVPGWSAALTDYAGRFVAAVQKGRVLACQFHPELSGQWGLALMRRWLAC